MKKVLTAALIVLVAVTCVFALVACNPAQAKVKVIDIDLTSEDYAFCVSKDNNQLLAQANAFLAEIKENGTLDDIINSFFNGESTFTYTNPTSKTGCFVVATNAEFPPFEYVDGNVFRGIDMQIAKLLADRLGKTLYIDNMEFDPIISSVKIGAADIGMAGLTVNEARREQVDFTSTYYTSAQVIIVREGDTTFDSCTGVEEIEAILKNKTKDYTIGAQNATTGYMYSNGDENMGYDGFTNLTTVGYTNGALAVKDLSLGKINAVIIDKQPAIMIKSSTNNLIK